MSRPEADQGASGRAGADAPAPDRDRPKGGELLSKNRAWYAAAALLALSIWEIVTLLRAHAGAPTEDDWAQVEKTVRAGWKAGDLVVFAPAWMDPVGREHLGDLLTLHDAARMDEARYATLWEVSEHSGSLRVVRNEHTAAPVSFDLRARSRLVEVDYAPRECAPLRPPATLDAGTVTLDKTLVVYAGLADFRARRDNRAQAKVRVAIDGAVVAERTVGNDDGWAPLPAIATTPGPHRVAFSSEVIPGSPGPVNLDLCVAAESRP